MRYPRREKFVAKYDNFEQSATQKSARILKING